MFGNSGYPSGTTVADVSRAAGDDIEPPAYAAWAESHFDEDNALRQRFMEEHGADLLDQMLSLPKKQPADDDERAHYIAKHGSFCWFWRVCFTEFYREEYRAGRLPQ